MTAQQVQDQITKAQVLQSSLGQRYAGLMQMFNAACLMQHGREMDDIRAALHVCVDQILDNNNTIYIWTVKLVELSGQIPKDT